MKSGKKHLFIEFAACNKVYECNFSIKLSLMENIILLIELINQEIKEDYDIDKYFMVYEKNQNVKLNLFIKLSDLNLEDNLTLIVY